MVKRRIAVTLIQIILLAVIAAVAGAIGQALAGYSLGGLLVSIVLGFVGALLGSWLARQLGLPELLTLNIGGEPFPVIWSIIGAFIIALLVGLIARPRRYRAI
jgi:uncharacterized membrane protein YeaQ/YmgE (transglycosylase-associated protein family)